MRIHNGRFVEASRDTFRAAAESADWHVPAAGGNTTPVLRFFNWALHQGEPIARELDYASVPRTVIDALPSLWGTLRDSSGKRLWTEDR